VSEGKREMKIVSGKLTFMNIPLRQAEYWAWGRRDIYTVGLVEFTTDTGLVGIGEVNVSMGPNEKVIAAIFDQMLDFYVGQSPFDSNIIMARIKGTGWYSYHRTASLVLGGLDMACWDLAGKAVGQPV
jgi:L-alanine-DL-glutamate epimerase-like enolase superfamily enzyme